jgi:hypothetical protein
MKKVIIAAALVLLAGSAAFADLLVKDGNGISRTIKNFVCETTKFCNATVLIDSSGAEISPLTNAQLRATPVPVSATAWPLPTGAATQATLAAIQSSLGSPFQAGGSIGNTAFGATQSGTWNITNISGTVSLPTGASTATLQTTTNTALGAPGATACASDTASCSLNQLMQRLAQNITAMNANVQGPIPAGTNVIGDVNVRQGGTALSPSNPMPTSRAATATGGATQHFVVAAATNNSTSLKGSAGTVYAIQTGSIAASAPYYLKLYDKATAPTCGTDTPVGVFLVPPTNSGNNVSVVVGKAFTLGIGYCVVTGIANNDNTAVPAATVLVNIDYK